MLDCYAAQNFAQVPAAPRLGCVLAARIAPAQPEADEVERHADVVGEGGDDGLALGHKVDDPAMAIHQPATPAQAGCHTPSGYPLAAVASLAHPACPVAWAAHTWADKITRAAPHNLHHKTYHSEQLTIDMIALPAWMLALSFWRTTCSANGWCVVQVYLHGMPRHATPRHAMPCHACMLLRGVVCSCSVQPFLAFMTVARGLV